MAYTITPERDPDVKDRTCRAVLEALPDWFQIPEAIDQFCRDVRQHPMWVVRDKDAAKRDAAVGFVSLKQHFAETAEIHLIAIRTEHHHKGLGHKLLAAAEAQLKGEDPCAKRRRSLLCPDSSFLRRRGLRAARSFSDSVG